MRKINASILVLTAAFLFQTGVSAQEPICTEGVKVGHGEAADGRAIEIRLHVRGGVVEKLEVLAGCDPVFIQGVGSIHNCSFIFNAADGNLDLSFEGTIEKDKFFTEELPPMEVCGTTFGGTVTGGASPVAPGTGGSDGGDDDDDGEGETGGPGGTSNGNGERLAGRRVAIDNQRPIAEVIGIEIEVNPPTIDMRRIASGVADVSITARLVWSNDNLPEDFTHDPTQWNFLTPDANGEWPAWESADNWGSSLRDRMAMEVRKAPEVEETSPKEAPLVWNFNMERRENVKALHLPIRAAYRTVAGDSKSEIDTIVNLRVDNQGTSGALAASAGPSARNVTFRRILE